MSYGNDEAQQVSVEYMVLQSGVIGIALSDSEPNVRSFFQCVGCVYSNKSFDRQSLILILLLLLLGLL